jgi:YD repeat-containing protein
VRDALGRVTTQTFDSMGRVLSTLTPDGKLTTNVIDLCGLVASSTVSAADGTDARTTVNTYDLMDRRIATTDALGYTSTATYNLFGEATGTTTGAYLRAPGDAGYDAALAALAHPASMSASYDRLGRIASTTDAAGMVTVNHYDARGNRTHRNGSP